LILFSNSVQEFIRRGDAELHHALEVALSEVGVDCGWVALSIVVVDHSHDIDGEPVHGLSNGETHVAKVILVEEDDSVLELLVGPGNILGISHLILRA